MTDKELQTTFQTISEALLTSRRENIRTLARLKALESMVIESIPAEKRDAWHELLNKQTKFYLHELLVSLEKQNPGAAAQIDNRESWEVGDGV